MKKISIAIICYNQEKFIKETIENCLNQTYKNIEICISDDYSTDNTYNIILDYEKKYPCTIKVYRQKENMWKHSLLINLQTVLNLCSWEYIALCEWDDYWIDNNKLQIQADTLEKNKNCDLCFHSAYELVWDKEWKLLWKHCNWNRIFSVNDIIMWDWGFCPTASLMFRRRSIGKLPNFFDTLPVWDYFLQVLWSLRWWAFYVDKPMSIYRINAIWSWSKSIETFAKKEKFLLSMINWIDLMNEFLKKRYLKEFSYVKFMKMLEISHLYLHIWDKKNYKFFLNASYKVVKNQDIRYKIIYFLKRLRILDNMINFTKIIWIYDFLSLFWKRFILWIK